EASIAGDGAQDDAGGGSHFRHVGVERLTVVRIFRREGGHLDRLRVTHCSNSVSRSASCSGRSATSATVFSFVRQAPTRVVCGASGCQLPSVPPSQIICG